VILFISGKITYQIQQMNQNLTVQEAEDHYQELKARGSQLDLTRGKPSSEQLDLSLDLENLRLAILLRMELIQGIMENY